MKIYGKHTHTFEIEYEIKKPETRYADNDPKLKVIFSFNKKQVKTYKKGLALTCKYLKKMRRLGFEWVEPTEVNNDTDYTAGRK